MKARLILILLALVVSAGSFAQQDAGATTKAEKNTVELKRHMDVTVGYVPKSDYKAIKASVSINNLLLKRIGFYTTFEQSFNPGNFANLIGGTVTVFKPVYLFGGIDMFTSRGLIQLGSVKEARKEVGVGFSPYKYLVVRLGYSFKAGPTFAAGIKFAI